MTLRRQALGRRGEEEAARYLAGLGYRVVERNFRCPEGEIDLIVLDGSVLVFVEVRSRSTDTFGLPQESVTGRKQKKVRRVAGHYLSLSGGHRGPLRFDVLAVKLGRTGELEGLEHIKNAF